MFLFGNKQAGRRHSADMPNCKPKRSTSGDKSGVQAYRAVTVQTCVRQRHMAASKSAVCAESLKLASYLE